MDANKQPREYIYPAVFTPLPGTGRWSVRFPDLAKEGEAEGKTLEEAVLCASRLLRENVDALEHDRQIAPPPSPYENIQAEEDEIVQLLVVETGGKKNKGRKEIGNSTVWVIIFIAVAIFIRYAYGSNRPLGDNAARTLAAHLHSLTYAADMCRANQPEGTRLSENENHLALLSPYMKHPEGFVKDNPSLALRVTDGAWWIGCDLPKWGRRNAPGRSAPREGLAREAQKRGDLFGSPGIDVVPISADAAYLYKPDMDAVWVLVGR